MSLHISTMNNEDRNKKGVVMNKRRYNTPVRVTKQVRINEKWYRQLKEVSEQRETTISKLLDHICKDFFQDRNNL